jgi:5-hydroxyisourate hydrolase-like protein (transthyretin family)
MRMRTRRVLVAVLGILAVAVLAPQLASADASTGALSGTVTNSAQQGIGGVTVELTDVSTGAFTETTTASDGTYTVNGLAVGGYQVLFLPPSGQNYVYQFFPDKTNSAAAQAVTVTGGQVAARADASLATGATISGTVTAAAGGAAVSGVRVYVREYGGGYPNYVSNTSATTDANGAWSVTGLPTGLYQVEFNPTYATNFASQDYNDVTGQAVPTPIALTAGATTPNIDAALTAGGQITGTVTDGTTGMPAQGVNVVGLDQSGNQLSSATTDAAGRYTLSNLSASASYRVEFFPAGNSRLESAFYQGGATLQSATPVAVTVGQSTPNINETLGEGGSISGVVTDAVTGYPLGGARILLTDDAGNSIFAVSGYSTLSDGSYSFTNLPPGSYKVEFGSVGALGFQYYRDARTLSTATALTVGAGEAVTNINAALTQGGTLKGTVTDAITGQGLADTYVEVVDSEGHYVTYGYTDSNGRYEIPGLAPGSYYIQTAVFNKNVDEVVFYGGKSTLAGAKPVAITAGATTSGIDIAVTPDAPTPPSVSGQSTTTPTTTTPQVPVAVVTQVSPGLPTLFGGSLSGLRAGKPVLRFHLAAGANGGCELRSFKVKLPAGLWFVGAQLAKGVKVTGGGKVTEKVIGGQLVVTLGSPSRAVTVTIGSPAVKVRRARGRAVRILVTVTPVNGTGQVLSFTVKNPS